MRYFAVLIGKHDEVPNDSIDRVVRTTRVARKAIGTDAPPALAHHPQVAVEVVAKLAIGDFLNFVAQCLSERTFENPQQAIDQICVLLVSAVVTTS